MRTLSPEQHLLRDVFRPHPVFFHESITLDGKEYYEATIDKKDEVICLKQVTNDGEQEIFLPIEYLRDLTTMADYALHSKSF